MLEASNLHNSKSNPMRKVHYLNVLGHSAEFQINQDSKYRTKLGLFCSIALISLITVIFIDFFMIYLDSSNPMVTSDESADKEFFAIPDFLSHIVPRVGFLIGNLTRENSDWAVMGKDDPPRQWEKLLLNSNEVFRRFNVQAQTRERGMLPVSPDLRVGSNYGFKTVDLRPAISCDSSKMVENSYEKELGHTDPTAKTPF